MLTERYSLVQTGPPASEPITLTECQGETDECWAAYRIICGQGRLTADRAGSVASKILGG